MARDSFYSVLNYSLLVTAKATLTFLFVAISPNSVQGDEICDADKVFTAAQSLFYLSPVDLDIRGVSVRVPERLAANPAIGRWGDTRTDASGSVRFHAGVDVLGDVGELIVAPIGGEIDSGSASGLGRFLDLNFEVAVLDPPAVCPVHFRFAHLSEITVAAGKILAGAAIGKIGRDGNAVGSDIPTHVHLEFWVIPQTQPEQDRRASTRDPLLLFGW